MDEIILQSCAIYQEIDCLYQKIGMTISKCSPIYLQQMTMQLNDLMAKAQEIDSRLADQLSENSERSPQTSALLSKREELLRNMLGKNRSVAKKAGNMKSHLKHEIGSMKTNRTAMQGYKPVITGNTRKRIINNSF